MTVVVINGEQERLLLRVILKVILIFSVTFVPKDNTLL